MENGGKGPESENALFGSQLFGFKREDVLRYIDRLEMDATQKEEQAAKALDEARRQSGQDIAQMLERLNAAQSENQGILEKTRALYTQLSEERERSKKLEEKHQRLADGLRAMQGRALAREQELISLRGEHAELEKREEGLSRRGAELDRREGDIASAMTTAHRTAQELTEGARREADDQRRALVAQSEGVGRSVAAFRQELARVEAQIDSAFAALKGASDQIEEAADLMDKQLADMGVEVERLMRQEKPAAPTEPEAEPEPAIPALAQARRQAAAVKTAVEKQRAAARPASRPKHRAGLQQTILDSISKMLKK